MPQIQATRETYDELQRAFDFFNDRLFDGKLPPCLITLQREKRTLGYFSVGRFVGRKSHETVDEIAMNPSYFSVRTIRDTLSTLVHEMVHAWQAHLGNPGKRGLRGYHNKEWANFMDMIGLCPSNTGEPGGKRLGEQMDHYIIEGGPFDQACAELITSEFTLSWLDRFPPKMKKNPAPAGSDGKGYIDDEHDPDSPGADVHDELDDEIAAALALVEPPPEGPVNKTNRQKYSCPVCKTNVWGKPGLILFCGGELCKKAEYAAT